MAWILSDYETGPLDKAIGYYISDLNELNHLERKLQEAENAYSKMVAHKKSAEKFLANRLKEDKVYVVDNQAISVFGSGDYKSIKLHNTEML